MKKILFLILGCMFVADNSVNGMVNRDGASFQLVYTEHARAQMETRNITELDIELAIEYGEIFLDKKSDEIAYNGRTDLMTFAVITQLSDQPNKLVIKGLTQAYSKANKKKKCKRANVARDKKSTKK